MPLGEELENLWNYPFCKARFCTSALTNLPSGDSEIVKYIYAHAYSSSSMCAFGIPVVIINIIVLTGKKLMMTINFILTFPDVAEIAT